MPVESLFPSPFPQILCVCVCGGGGLWGWGWLGEWVDMEARVSVASECACLLYPSIFIFSSSFCFG